jgi:divinyl protochlorophyllide a 8-vinyl-reductase
MLMAAVRKHAWTFVGAGAFMPQGAWRFTIDRSRAGDSLPPPESLFHWYAAVFTRLYRQLVADDCRCAMIEPDVPCDMARSYAIARDRPTNPRVAACS